VGAEEYREAGIDFDRPNAARMYDYLLGGAHNFAVDRELAERAIAGHPTLRYLAQANRGYLRRVVEWCLEEGIDQFLDLGSGVPTVGNVHEIAQASVPGARVAYVDFEPVAVAHAAEIIGALDTATDTETVTVTRADLRLPDTVLTAPGVAELLDFTRPVAVLAIAVLHFVDDDLAGILAAYRDVLAPGSVIALSHSTDDSDDPAVAASVRAVAEAYRGSATPLILRDRAAIAAILGGLDVVAPGTVDIVDWPHPDPAAERTSVYSSVGRCGPAAPPTSGSRPPARDRRSRRRPGPRPPRRPG
jgi:SAM-dependent methyltransferase